MSEKRRQTALIFVCVAIYAFAYVGRYSFSSNLNSIMDYYGTGKSETGLIGTFFFFAYGIGQILNGIFCKHYNKKWVLSIAMLVSAFCNLLVFIGVPFMALKFIWLVNGVAQSFLWSSLISLVSQNVSHDRLRFAVTVLSTSLAIGTFISYGASALFNLVGKFKYSFLLGALCLTTIGVLWFIFHDKLTSKPTNFIEKEFALDKEPSKENTQSKAIAVNLTILFISLSVFAVINNFIKDGLNTWVPTILKDTYGFTNSLSIALTLVLPVLNVFGSVMSEWVYAKLKNFITTLSVLSFVAMLFILIIVLTLKSIMIVSLLSFGIVALLMTGITHIIVSSAPVYMRSKMDSGLASGLLDGFCYLGSTISSYGLGFVAESLGWHGAFYIMLGACAIPVVVGVILTIIQSIKKSNPKEDLQ